MSAIQVTSGNLTTMCNSITNHLNSPAFLPNSGHGIAFPLCKNKDTVNLLGGNYLMIEAKHIFIAAMANDIWDDVLKKFHQWGVEDPAECPAGYRVSQALFWPASADTQTAGLAALAADKQADIVADAMFQRLMNIKNKGAAKAHGTLAKQTEQVPTEEATDVESDAGSLFVAAAAGSRASSASRGTRSPLAATDEMDIDEPPSASQATATDIIPSAWNAPRTYRLSRDWKGWPSAGPLDSEVSNCQQAQYGIIADTVFETTKVEVSQAKRVTARGLLGNSNAVITQLAADSGAQTVYFKILTAYAQTGKKLRLQTSANIVEEAAEFMNYLFDQYPGDFAYNNDNSEEKAFDTELKQFREDEWARLFVTLCKQQKAAKKQAGGDDGGDAHSVAGSIDDSLSLAGDIDAAVYPNPAASGSASRASSRGRGRGSARARAGSSARGTGTGTRATGSGTRATSRGRGSLGGTDSRPPRPSPLSKRPREDDDDDFEQPAAKR